MVVNHDIPKTLMEKMFVEVFGFFNLTEEESKSMQRDFLKIFVHPEFHSPDKPAGFRETCEQYCRRARHIARELLKRISESLGLEPSYIEQALNLDSGLQVFIANFYPPCPQPDMAMGMPPHSDHGLLTLLSQNGVIGLQILHKGKWVNVNAIPNCLVVNVSDHIEILSNGKYKSVLHKAAVSSKATRISIAVANGPSGDTFVVPAAELVKKESNPAAYVGMKYKEYLGLQQSNQLDGKSALDRVRI
ncbi:putative 2-oxoglutarate and Fe(II)-dependent oxygenase superfamily protein [Quillaja saponaria]|uniref:2-oxoglutarate and Fe(II)-dependent oxygenase superfamily protein n=1 Tax=Quillaja saponaria TaxID=32244 RepID=A0AAD7M3Z5_QUISA|nr:putative 2-oxoglutarate and Fe(II)-dependent oxygenase superfamily protein [Quillaja saponaria]